MAEPSKETPASGPVAGTSSNTPAPTGAQQTSTFTDEPLAVAEDFHDGETAQDDDADADSALDDGDNSTASIASSILHYRMINGRTYHSDRYVNADAVPYWGANDAKQNQNLDIMHGTFLVALDGKLSLAPLPEKLEKVLDLGTGTGQWCIDFGDDHPECQVIGTDISPIQPEWVPPNVQFEIDDFTQPWTREDNSLDYIHLRWICGTVTDWTELFRQAYRVLKPGGWIESFDCNGFPESDDGTLTEDTALHKWGYLIREGAKALGSRASFAVVQDGLQVQGLKEAGFTNITENPVKVPTSEWAKDQKHKQMGMYMRATLENDTEGAIGFMASQIGWSKDEISVYAAHLRRELRTNKVHAYCRFNLVYAQKPLNA